MFVSFIVFLSTLHTFFITYRYSACMKKYTWLLKLTSRVFLFFMLLALLLPSFWNPVFCCELYISPTAIEVIRNEKKLITVSKQVIHKKCKQDVSGIQIYSENCLIESESDWISEGFNWKKELTVIFPAAGEAYLTLSNSCELFPIRPFRAVYHVKEVIQSPSAAPTTTPSAPISSPESVTESVTPTKSDTFQPISPNKLDEKKNVNSTQTVAEPLTTQRQRWSDYFLKYEFYILIMLLMLSIVLNVTFQSRFRFLVNLVSLGYLGFFTGGCLCTIGLIEKAPIFGFTTSLGVFSILLITLLMVVSLLFGRIFCGWVCPQGVLQEFLYRSSSHQSKQYKTRLLYRILPGFSFFLVFIVSYFWKISVLCEFDPFRIPFHLTGSALLLSLFILIAVLSIYYYRPYCRFFCPLGFLLGTASWLGGKLNIRWIGKKVNCDQCVTCSKNCLSDALTANPSSLQIDAFSCIECGSCHEACFRFRKKS